MVGLPCIPTLGWKTACTSRSDYLMAIQINFWITIFFIVFTLLFILFSYLMIKRNKTKLLNKIMILSLLFLGILFIIIPYRYEEFFYLFFVSFVIAIFSYLIIKLFKLSEKQYFMILTIIWLNSLGELWFYFNWFYYDKLLHFIVPILISYIYLSYLKKKNQSINIFFPFTILGLLAFFEIFEWIIHTFIGFPMLGVFDTSGEFVMDFLTDTMLDLIMGFCGTLTFLILKKSDIIKFSE